MLTTRLFTTLLLLLLPLLSHAQWYDPTSRGFFLWSPFVTQPPSGMDADGCTILPRDFNSRWREPLVKDADWKDVACVLEAKVNHLQLFNVRNPTDFLNARRDHAAPPTLHVWVNDYGPQPITPMNPIQLTTFAQAVAVAADLKRLRMVSGLSDCDVTPWENTVTSWGSKPKWASGDIRRHYMIGRINAGLVRQVYAGTTVEHAEAKLKLELADACPTPSFLSIGPR